LIGTAPSPELLATWNERETGLVNAKENIGCCPAVAHLPEVKGSYVGQDLDEATRKKIYEEGARTIPGREHGGNCDIKK
jgi:formamidase